MESKRVNYMEWEELGKKRDGGATGRKNKEGLDKYRHFSRREENHYRNVGGTMVLRTMFL